MAEYTTVAIDAMGGDNAPAEIVRGAVLAAKEREDIRVILVGMEEKIREELKKDTYPEDRVEVKNATEIISMSEHPVAAIRKKKDSSMNVGMKLVRDGEADAFISAGNSGAVMVGGQAIVGRIRGIEKPPFGSVIPTTRGMSFLLDCGANVDARAEHLVQFARIGSIYMEHVLGVKNPTVGLVNIGTEEEKGNALVKETYPLLKACTDLNFIGSCEARDIPEGPCDVIVAEGFTGNVVLKLYEGVASTLLRVVKSSMVSDQGSFLKTLRTKLGALMIKPALKKTLAPYDASKYGGAPVLGLKGLVVKMHGNAKADVVRLTVFQCAKFKEERINAIISEQIAGD